MDIYDKYTTWTYLKDSDQVLWNILYLFDDENTSGILV